MAKEGQKEELIGSAASDQVRHCEYDDFVKTLSIKAEAFEAGCTRFHVAQWKNITSEPWTLKTIQGCSIDLLETPVQKIIPSEIPFARKEQLALNAALTELLAQGVISECNWEANGFCSNYFGRTKKNGSARIILNLSNLNEFVENYHFKMETIREAIALMRPGCYFASIDFKHAYYLVPIDESDRKYLMFRWGGKLFRFNALPQGLSSAPRIFTKLMKAPFSHLREQGFTVLGYIDDTIFIEDEAIVVTRAVDAALHLFDGLGLTVSVQKSVLKPTKMIEYLGFVLNSDSMTVTLTVAKQKKIRRLAGELLKRIYTTVQLLAEFIGNVVAAEHGVYAAPLHYKRLEIVRNEALTVSKGCYDFEFKLTDEAREDIQWWFDNVHKLSKSALTPEPRFIIESDASKKGWGATCDGTPTRGDWSETESRRHINWLELYGAFLALQSYCKSSSDCHICLILDNTAILHT